MTTTEELIEQNKANDNLAVTGEDPLDTPEVNKAARDFNGLMPTISRCAAGMSLRQLRRVVLCFAEFPMGDSKLKTKEEHELFMYMLHAEGLKGVMRAAVIKNEQQLKELQDQAAQAVADEVLKQEQGEA